MRGEGWGEGGRMREGERGRKDGEEWRKGEDGGGRNGGGDAGVRRGRGRGEGEDEGRRRSRARTGGEGEGGSGDHAPPARPPTHLPQTDADGRQQQQPPQRAAHQDPERHGHAPLPQHLQHRLWNGRRPWRQRGRGGGAASAASALLPAPPSSPCPSFPVPPSSRCSPPLHVPSRYLPPSPRSSPAPRAPPRRCPPGSRTSLRRAPSSSSSTALPAALSVAVLTIRTLLNVACTERNERGGPKARPPQTASLFAVGLARCPVPPPSPHRSEEVVVHRSEDVNGDAVAPLQPPQGAAQLPAPRVAAVLWGHGDGAGGTDPPRPPQVPESPPAALTILPTRCRSAGCTAVTLLLGGSRSSHVAWGRAGGAWGGQRSA